MIAHAYAFGVIVCQSEFEALVLEASQIKAHTPKYNILLREDDKGYSYIRVTPGGLAAPFLHPAKGGGQGRVYRPLHLQLCGHGRWQKRPWMPFCCRAAPSASRRTSERGGPA